MPCVQIDSGREVLARQCSETQGLRAKVHPVEATLLEDLGTTETNVLQSEQAQQWMLLKT